MVEPANDADRALLLVRLGGEITTKSRRVRDRFQKRLMENLRDALRSEGIEHRVSGEWSRIFVEAETPQALDVVTRVFGVQSASLIDRRCAPELDEIVRVGHETYAELVRGRKFAVRAHRTGEQPFKSLDVHVQLGRALNEHAEVDLSHPDVTVRVEIRPEAAYLFSGQSPGPGGIPLGVQGRAVALISGGFDSAAAAWLMLKRGINLDYVLCNLAGAAYERTVLSVAKVLADSWSYGTRPRLHVVDFEPVVTSLLQNVTPRYGQVVLKRLMYRTATLVAEELEALAVVTGEAVGQVSSQTLANLRAIDEVCPLPVLRPLVGMDKEEIIARTRQIGTYALSALVHEYCAVVPDKPATAAKPEAARDEESRVDLSLLERAVAERKVVDIRALGPGDLVLPYVYTDEVPEGAVVIDCRSDYQYRAWHWPDARHVELDALLDEFPKLDREATYVLYCPIGLQTAVAAEKMQRAGYEAYSFKGGSQALRKLAVQRGLED